MSNKHTTVPTIPPSVADAERAISNLEQKKTALIARGNQFATNRASVAFKALNDDDAAAKQKLDQINKETGQLGAEVASVDAALVTARQRLAVAQRAEARAADRERAQAIRSEWSDAAKDF